MIDKNDRELFNDDQCVGQSGAQSSQLFYDINALGNFCQLIIKSRWYRAWFKMWAVRLGQANHILFLVYPLEDIPDDGPARIFGNGILSQDPMSVDLWELQATFFKNDPLA